MATHAHTDHDQHQPRHYPLDTPHLPFDRYDHRRLTARDVMIHRLMAEFMNPSEHSIMLDEYATHHSTGSTASCELTPRRRMLLMDLEVLERMLFTLSPPCFPEGPRYRDGIVYVPPNNVYSIGDHFLHLAARHYFEVDSIAMRTWVSRARLPLMLESPLLGPNHRRRAPGPTRKDEQVRFQFIIDYHRDRGGLHWDERHRSHLSGLRPKVNMQDRLPLYDGGACLPTMRQTIDAHEDAVNGTKQGLNLPHFSLDDDDSASIRSFFPFWPEFDTDQRYILLPGWRAPGITHLLELGLLWEQTPVDLCLSVGRGKNRDGIWATGRPTKHQARCASHPNSRHGRSRRRCTSEPPPRSFTASLFSAPMHLNMYPTMQILTPRMPLSQLAARSRRRSLSRTRIEELFDWDTHLESSINSSPPPATTIPGNKPTRCDNCAQTSHRTTLCRSPCGHCGAPSPWDRPPRRRSGHPPPPYEHHNPHRAPDCPVAAHNRCKCIAFPTFHTAAQCGIPCRRACTTTTTTTPPAPAPAPGTFHHPNAITCRARCCMCGLRGSHSGRECRLQRCRCGGAHLGQDCGWKVACRVAGCDRFLCGVHCRGCGGTERPFVKRAGRCWRCDGLEGRPVVGWGLEGRGRGRRRRGRGRKGEGVDGEVGQLSLAEELDEIANAPMTVEPSAVVSEQADREAEPDRELLRGHQSIFGDPRAKNLMRTNR